MSETTVNEVKSKSGGYRPLSLALAHDKPLPLRDRTLQQGCCRSMVAP